MKLLPIVINYLRKFTFVIVPYQMLKTFRQIGIRIDGILLITFFMHDFRAFRHKNDNPYFSVDYRNIFPCLLDRTELTPLEPTYFFQDSWAAEKIFNQRPDHHYDIGSSAKTMGIISQFVPTTMIDIRPIDLELPNLYFRKGSILSLPFKDETISSLSTLSVVEHIGLGRFGDPIDSWGSEKAIKELKRVLQPGGNIYFSVPVDSDCRIYFNAHRAFTRDYILELFNELVLVEEKYVYGRELCGAYDQSRGFGTGLFHFKKGNL